MKKTFLLIAFVIFASSVTFGQNPFKYQAVIRDNSGIILPNKNVGLRISIMQGDPSVMTYREEFNKTSDQFGVINLEIGKGYVLNGNYLNIDWSKINNQLQIEIDLNGGTTYTLLGTAPILSAPIANYAYKAGGATFPAGLIMPFGGTIDKIPTGWLLCDGSEVNRVDYADLFNAISINWGAGNLTTTFNLPDMRGSFLRGVDGTKGNDPDKANRTAAFNGGNTGNSVGSIQGDDFKNHNHTFLEVNDPTPGNNTAWTNYPVAADGANSGVVATGTATLTGGNETRPKNVYVYYIIKY